MTAACPFLKSLLEDVSFDMGLCDFVGMDSYIMTMGVPPIEFLPTNVESKGTGITLLRRYAHNIS